MAEDETSCRAGHPCPIGTARRVGIGGWASRRVAPLRADASATPVSARRRATELLARALSHEDAEADGICADQVLADPAVALALLGSPDTTPAARDAVVQRFGLVGAFLVLGHEDRWRRHLAVLSGDAATTSADDEVSGHLERLVRHFPHLGVPGLETLLNAIDRAETGRPADQVSITRHRLHATYAVAARDGSDESHHEYMESLNEVLRMTRPAVAS